MTALAHDDSAIASESQLLLYRAKLASKLAVISGDVGALEKDGTFTGKTFSYNFISADNIKAKLKPLLAREKVHVKTVMDRSSLKTEFFEAYGQTNMRVWLWVDLCATDGETGFSDTTGAWGYAEDRGDKGIQKAISAAEKYALREMFQICTGDDADGDNPPRADQDAGTHPGGAQQGRGQLGSGGGSRSRGNGGGGRVASMNRSLSPEKRTAIEALVGEMQLSAEEVSKAVSASSNGYAKSIDNPRFNDKDAGKLLGLLQSMKDVKAAQKRGAVPQAQAANPSADDAQREAMAQARRAFIGWYTHEKLSAQYVDEVRLSFMGTVPFSRPDQYRRLREEIERRRKGVIA